ncbi:MAG: cysteine synthase family protein [Faecalibacterium sp.]
MAIIKNYYQTLYHCPIVQLSHYSTAHALKGNIYAYLDFGGATGSAKDGLAEGMIALAYESGKLLPKQQIIEASSSTFAVALTIAARAAGHPVQLVVPESLSAERQKLLKNVGAQLVFSNPQYGRVGAEQLAQKIAKEANAYYMNYFSNGDNLEYHRRMTGTAIVKEITKTRPSLVDAIVVGVGSGGTISGVGEQVRAWTNDVRMVAVEPYECQAIGGGFLGKHKIPGIGAGFIPENYNPYVVDNVIAVSSGDAVRAAKEVLRADAIPACASAGATLYAARQLIEQGKSKNVLCIFSGRQLLE